MMRMKIILTILLTIGIFISNGQDLISTAGDFFQMPGGSISFTIGEALIETIENGDYALTQGFQQSSTRDIVTNYNPLDEVSINIYPNPTTDYIKIELSEKREIKYQLLELHGKMVAQDHISQIESTISLTNFPPSVYILKLMDNNLSCRSFQIVKK